MKHSPNARSGRRLALALGVGLALLPITHALAQNDTAPSTQPAANAGGYTDGEQGLKYRVISQPDAGRVAQEGDVVMVHYTGKLADGTEFDTSRQIRPGGPNPFPTPIMLRLGDGRVIPGWELGLLGMKVGERRELVIPPDLAYGDAGAPPKEQLPPGMQQIIPPGATLTFDVELVGLARDASE